MKNLDKILQYILIGISVFFTTLCVVLFFTFILNRQFFSLSYTLDIELATNFGIFFQGLVGTTAGISGSLLVICVFLLQRKQVKISQLENIYFKMIDYHHDNVKSMSTDNYKLWMNDKKEKAQVFVSFKLQLFECIDMVKELNNFIEIKLNNYEIIDVAYMVFYYGIDERWNELTKNYL